MANVIQNPCDEAVIRAGKANSPCARRAGPWVLAAAILGSGMAFVDGNAVTVALPSIQTSLGASAVDAQWVVEAYTLFLAALVLVGGAFGDRFGRRRMFASGVVVFTVASILCGFAGSAGQLIAARAFQGIGGALLVPNSLAIIGASFPRRRNARIGGADHR